MVSQWPQLLITRLFTLVLGKQKLSIMRLFTRSRCDFLFRALVLEKIKPG